MKQLIALKDLSIEDISSVFEIAESLEKGFQEELKGKSFALFFPESSIRTRVSYEIAIHSMGGNIINFPENALDKKEDVKDVVGYLENWVDGIILRNSDYNKIKYIAECSSKVVINAMSKENHPCEILTDLYTFRKMRRDYRELTYLFIGPATNIGRSYYHAAEKLGFQMIQSCPKGTEIAEESEIFHVNNLLDEVIGKADIIITDGVEEKKEYFEKFQITQKRVEKMKEDALLNLTPPFYRGSVISKELDLDRVKQFVGYEFKKNLLNVQAAIILWCLKN